MASDIYLEPKGAHKDNPFLQGNKIIGWQCPKCGRGNSPYATVCPCGPNFETTTANTTGKLPAHFWPSGNE